VHAITIFLWCVSVYQSLTFVCLQQTNILFWLPFCGLLDMVVYPNDIIVEVVLNSFDIQKLNIFILNIIYWAKVIPKEKNQLLIKLK